MKEFGFGTLLEDYCRAHMRSAGERSLNAPAPRKGQRNTNLVGFCWTAPVVIRDRTVLRLPSLGSSHSIRGPEEHEATIKRLEKVLEGRGQSLSEFFIQSVKNAVPGKPRRQGEEIAKVRIPSGVTCGIAVDAEWRHSGAVNVLIGPPDNPRAKASGSSLIFAKILDADDPSGLWIELNSEQKRNPGYPVLRFVIPWRFIVGVCVDPSDLPNAARAGKRYGFPDSGIDVTSIMAEVLRS